MAVEYLSWWAQSWISPGAAFFLFVNVLIGAIVVTSRGQQKHQGGRAAAAAASTRRLCRSASSMVHDRLRSFTMFSVVHPAAAAVPMELEMEEYRPLELEAEEQQHHQPAVPEPASWCPAAAAVGAVAAPATGGGASSEIIEKEEAEAGQDKFTSSYDNEAEAQGRLALQGHRQQPPPSVDAVTADEASENAVESQEETAMQMRRQRAPACRRGTEETPEGKAALNARAESFIRRFREDLKLERLNSIINYTRTLRRGAAPPTWPQ